MDSGKLVGEQVTTGEEQECPPSTPSPSGSSPKRQHPFTIDSILSSATEDKNQAPEQQTSMSSCINLAKQIKKETLVEQQHPSQSASFTAMEQLNNLNKQLFNQQTPPPPPLLQPQLQQHKQLPTRHQISSINAPLRTTLNHSPMNQTNTSTVAKTQAPTLPEAQDSNLFTYFMACILFNQQQQQLMLQHQQQHQQQQQQVVQNLTNLCEPHHQNETSTIINKTPLLNIHNQETQNIQLATNNNHINTDAFRSLQAEHQIDAPLDKLDMLKPAHSYIGLIAMCILSTPEKRMVLNDIYQFILDNYPYYRNRGNGWRNSVRHNLSLNDCFMKCGRSANGKGHYWCIHPANMDDFMLGDFRRRRAQRRVRRWMGLHVPSDESEDESATEATKPPLPEHFKRSLEMHRMLNLRPDHHHLTDSESSSQFYCQPANSPSNYNNNESDIVIGGPSSNLDDHQRMHMD